MNKVKKIISALLIICMCAVMAFVNKTDILAAGTARVSIGSASGTVGDTVSIDVSISASSGIGGATIYVSYDPSILALSGSSSNSGTAMVSFMDESTASSQSKTITFKIIGAGTSSLNVIGDSKVIDIDMQACSISKSSGSVTASAPASYSSDNTLSSLQISPGVLSPAFSPDVTTYTTSVGADCASLTVSAVPNDSKATVSVSGKRMDPGFNTTTITVTAENGSKRTYTIKTTKETNSASNENNQATGSDSSNGSTDNNNDIPDVQDPNSEAIQEPNITVDNAEYKIVSANDEHPLPDGYTPTEYDYNGTKVSAGVGIDTGVTIVYLESTDGKGESGYYVYDSVRKTFSQFVEVSQPQFTYCILAIDEASMELPEGYDVGRTVINGKEVDALLDRTGNYALFYGVSSTGETGWFRYNVNDGTIQGYAGYNMADEQVINTNTKTADSDKAFNTVKTKICPHCQKEFVPTSNRQIFCSKDCCYQARQDKTKADREAEKGNHYYRQRVCAVCGSTYWPAHSQQKFCSEECQKQNHNEKSLEFYHKKQKEKSECKDLLQTKELVSSTNSSEIITIPA